MVFTGKNAKEWKYTSGSPNEVWSYGEEVYQICEKYLKLREKMRPYIKEQMRAAHEKGTPVMRPLFFDYPEDTKAWEIEDQYMFGPDILVAPVVYEGTRELEVYLPEGEWVQIHSKDTFAGGQKIICKAELDEIPVFVKREKEEIFYE